MLPKWSYQLLTGNEIIDRQHQEIFERAARLIEPATAGKTKASAVGIIIYLERCYHGHFAVEEALQRRYKFPEYAVHKEIHDKFRTELTTLKEKLVSSSARHGAAEGIIAIMLEWLAKHIDEYDKRFALHVQNVQAGKPVSSSRSAGL